MKTTFAERLAALHDPSSPRVLVAGHRGLYLKDAELRAPENSLRNLEACLARGLDAAELDVRRTRDGVLVLMHESRLVRTTGHPGKVEELDWDEVRALRLRYRDGLMSNEHPPRLEEVLELVKDRLLLKLHPKFGYGLYPKLREMLGASGTLAQVLVWEDWRPGSAEQAEREQALAEHPGLAELTFFVNIVDSTHLGEAATRLRPKVIEVEFEDPGAKVFAPETIVRIRAAGARASVNCQGKAQKSAGIGDHLALSDPDAGWGVFLDRGITFFQTNEPERMMQYVRTRSLGACA